MAALDGAFALAQIEHVAVLVADHLDFDVARLGDEFLDEEAVVAEAGARFVLRGLDRLGQVLLFEDDAQAFAAAACRGLHHHRIADVLGDGARMRFIFDLAHEARHGRDLGRDRQLLGFDLVAHGGDGFGVRPDEDDADLGQRFRKGFALGEKAVAGMHRLGARVAAGLHDLVDLQDRTAPTAAGPDAPPRPPSPHAARRIGVGIDGDGLDAHLARRLDDAAGDFAAIGDQNFLEHECQLFFAIVLSRAARNSLSLYQFGQTSLLAISSPSV